MTMHRRGQDMKNDWPAAIEMLRNETAGSVLAMHMMAGDLSYAQTSAGRYYAQLVGEYDRFFGIHKRSASSMAYDRGYGREDELERKVRTGEVKAYEKRAKMFKKRYEKVHRVIGETGPMRDIIEKVCLHDRRVLQDEIPVMVSGLELMARHFAFNPAGERQRVVSHGEHQRRRPPRS
jgi:hypothetical protein